MADSFHMDLENREVKMTNGQIDDGQRKDRISVSVVVDIQTMNKPKYERLSNTLMAVMNSKDVKGIDLETAQGTGQKLSSSDASFRWHLCRMAA